MYMCYKLIVIQKTRPGSTTSSELHVVLRYITYPMVYVVNGRQYSAYTPIVNMAMESVKIMLGALQYSKASAYHPPLPHHGMPWWMITLISSDSGHEDLGSGLATIL